MPGPQLLIDPTTRQLTRTFIIKAQLARAATAHFSVSYTDEGAYWVLDDLEHADGTPLNNIDALYDTWFATTCSRGESMDMLVRTYKHQESNGGDSVTVYLNRPH